MGFKYNLNNCDNEPKQKLFGKYNFDIECDYGGNNSPLSEVRYIIERNCEQTYSLGF
jgi:hypothetical protein